MLSRSEEVARLTSLGATVVRDMVREDGRGWVVMADPAGNEYCVERGAAERGEAPVDSGERELPPIHAADERAMLAGRLDWYRAGVVAKVAGLAQEHATRSPLRSGTTPAGLVKHLALVEDSWFTHGLAQQPEPQPWAGAPFDDDPDWEFHSAADEPLAETVALYETACARSREVASVHDLGHSATNARGRVFTLRWVLLHLVEETARHLGHLDVLCELADGRTGE
ncbi:MAG: DinB family protein [Frankiales bacterium]|nr:DinB family protein [Frankiales bacterium]